MLIRMVQRSLMGIWIYVAQTPILQIVNVFDLYQAARHCEHGLHGLVKIIHIDLKAMTRMLLSEGCL